jgi:hypothetical protein
MIHAEGRCIRQGQSFDPPWTQGAFMYPHRIRLHGPWECEPLTGLVAGANASTTFPRRVNMPYRWDEAGLANFIGCVRFRRRFGYPGRIEVHERVWLTFAGLASKTEVRLNGLLLGQQDKSLEAFEFEVTGLLQARNELIVDVEGTARSSSLWDEVALEVRCTAFLRQLRCFAILTGQEAELRVSGQVVGVAERPLELYIVLDRSVIAYQQVTATEDGRPFEVVVPALDREDWLDPAGQLRGPVVQVDLVNGATVWYTSEGTLSFEPRSDEGK